MKLARDDARIAAGTLLLFAACFLIYWPALAGGFIWDDWPNIRANPLMYSPTGLRDIWLGGDYVYDYYPLTWTTWWLEWRAWGRDTRGYHVLNVLLHAGAAALLWRVLIRLGAPGAFVVALVFAVHPINVESVAWISERKNTLSTFMLVITLALYLESESSDTPRRKRGLYWASVVTFAMSLLAKPAAVMLPVVIVALAWWRRGRVTRADWLRAVPLGVVSASVAVVTILFHHDRGIAALDVRDDGLLGRLAGAGWAVWFYLYKLLWPANLAFIYPRWQIDPATPLHWAPVLALLALSVALVLARRAIGRGPVVALACYVAMLFPVLGFVDIYFMRFSLVSDHWQYQASIVGIAAIVGGAAVVMRRFRRPAGVAIASAVCGVLGVLAWHKAHAYQSGQSLWGNAVRDNPRAMVAHANYAAELAGSRAYELATQHYEAAIALEPAWREPYVGMARLMVMQHRPADAVSWLRQAVGKPGAGTDPQILLADALAGNDHTSEAIELYERALADDPRAPVRPQLASLHLAHGRPARAIELYRQHARDSRGDVEAQFLLAGALARTGDPAGARDALAAARALAANDPTTLNGMGIRLLAGGYPALALDPLGDAVRLDANFAPGHTNLGRALLALDRPAEAAAAYERALQLQPGLHEASEGLVRARSVKSAQTRPAAP